MSDNTLQQSDLDDAIAAYRKACQARNHARFMITAGLILIVAFFIFLDYQEVINFSENRTEEFGAALTQEVGELSPMALESVNATVQRLVPIYTETFYDSVDNNQERFSQVLVEEYQTLQTYAQDSWPAIEVAMAELVATQEDVARHKLLEYVPEDKLVKLSEVYRQSLEKQMNKLFAQNFGESMLVAENIVEKLQKVAALEENMAPKDSQFVLGMLIELLGVQMQINSAGTEALTR